MNQIFDYHSLADQKRATAVDVVREKTLSLLKDARDAMNAAHDVDGLAGDAINHLEDAISDIEAARVETAEKNGWAALPTTPSIHQPLMKMMDGIVRDHS